MLTSVQAGIAAAPLDTEWFVLALGDQPSLVPGTVAQLFTEARQGDATIVVPSYAGRRGHPLLIHHTHRQEIGALGGENGLRALLHAHPESIRHVLFPDEAVLSDMDTPEEYQRELERLRTREAESRSDL
jgi:molybdenum cofactor cytidylyltransferase